MPHLNYRFFLQRSTPPVFSPTASPRPFTPASTAVPSLSARKSAICGGKRRRGRSRRTGNLCVSFFCFLQEYTGCGLVRAPPSVFVLLPIILKQFSNFKNPLHNESKLVSLFFLQKILKLH